MQIEAAAAPIADGVTVELRVMLHNRSATPATGGIAVELVHDRATPQPLPARAEVFHLRAGEIRVLTFDVPLMAMRASPYTFFAVVDAANSVRESDELANTAWRRFEVCEAPGAEEIADGFDNDCDGQLDEELGGPPDTAAALAMLRALQRRAQRDGAPLVWALPRLFAPFATQRSVRLASEEGAFVGKMPAPAAGAAAAPPATAPGAIPAARLPSGDLGAVLLQDAPGAELTLVDWNGGALRGGDLISLHLPAGEGDTAPREADAVIAVAGGGGRVSAGSDYPPRESLFTISTPGAPAGTPIANGDAVLLVASTGHFVSAEQGGGGSLSADRPVPSGWETFTLTLRER